MKYLILSMSLLVLAACSDGNHGLRFSDGHKEATKREKAAQVSDSCAFTDIGYQNVSDEYSSATEGLITELFQKYVTGLEPFDSDTLSGQVKYSDWLSNAADKTKLCTVVNHLANTDASKLTDADKKAFYINAYNILTIELILKSYPEVDKGDARDKFKFPDAKSIKNINDLGDAVWDTYKWKVGSQALTLNQIEKGILIPMNDARVHFAVNCASKGCPPLRNEAFTASKLDDQLNEMSDFFVSSIAYHDFELFDDYDPESGDNFYYISPIFQWYADDFKNDESGNYGSVRAFLVRHIKTPADVLGFPLADLLNEDYWQEEFESYDWSLNEVGN